MNADLIAVCHLADLIRYYFKNLYVFTPLNLPLAFDPAPLFLAHFTWVVVRGLSQHVVLRPHWWVCIVLEPCIVVVHIQISFKEGAGTRQQ